MLQQTQVKTVIPYWSRWMEKLPTIASLAGAKEQAVLKLWEGLGYYSRARNLQKAAQLIVREYSGNFPNSHEVMLTLPGIGRYTAGAISSIAFNLPEPIVDGNVVRVLTRIHGITGNPRDKSVNGQIWGIARELVETAALKNVAGIPVNTPRCSHLNQSLMELGALTCIPRQPRCAECPVRENCDAKRTGRTETIPNLGVRAKATNVSVAAFVVECNGKYLVRKRKTGEVNAGLWEFPNYELGTAELSVKELQELVFKREGLRIGEIVPLIKFKHSITRYRITLQAWSSKLSDTKKPSRTHNVSWISVAELFKLPFTSAHKKIISEIG